MHASCTLKPKEQDKMLIYQTHPDDCQAKEKKNVTERTCFVLLFVSLRNKFKGAVIAQNSTTTVCNLIGVWLTKESNYHLSNIGDILLYQQSNGTTNLVWEGEYKNLL